MDIRPKNKRTCPKIEPLRHGDAVMHCPDCQISLREIRGEKARYWQCTSCEGRAVAMSVLRRISFDRLMSDAWAQAKQQEQTSQRACAACRLPMSEVTVSHDGHTLVLDLCTRCAFLWMDAHELHEMTSKLPPPSPESARALIERGKLQGNLRGNSSFGTRAPDEMWKLLPAAFGLPVEVETSPVARTPIVTWILFAAIPLCSLIAFFLPYPLVSALAFLPADPWRHGGLTLLSSFLVHGSLFQLTSNMAFLAFYGDDVEDALGHGRFLALILAGTLVGNVLHGLFSDRALIGASGSVSAVIVFYTLLRPRARLGLLLYHAKWVHFPAWFGLVLWGVQQLLLLAWYGSSGGISSALSHIGGAAVGGTFWFFYTTSLTRARGESEARRIS